MNTQKRYIPVSRTVRLIFQLQPVWFLPAHIRYFWKTQRSAGTSCKFIDHVHSRVTKFRSGHQLSVKPLTEFHQNLISGFFSDEIRTQMDTTCAFTWHTKTLIMCVTSPSNIKSVTVRWHSAFTSIHHCDLKKRQRLFAAASSASFPGAVHEATFSILTSSPWQQAS